MEGFESKENEQVNLLTDKTNFGNDVDDYEKRKQHAMQIEQILKPELLIDRRLFPENKETMSSSSDHHHHHNGSSSSSSSGESVDQLKQEVRSLRNELDETRSELARVQINFNSFEIESRQALQKQTIEMEKLRKKLIFIMRKGFLAQMDASSSTFIGNGPEPAKVEAGSGHVSRPRTRKNQNGAANNNNNDSSVDEAEDDAESKFNKRKSSEYEEDGVIKF